MPGPWPQYKVGEWMAEESQALYRAPSWKETNLKTVDLAWYQREISMPQGWAGRRVVLRAEYVNSYAAVYLDGKLAGELNHPGGAVEITPLCRPGKSQVLTMLVAAKPKNIEIKAYENEPANAPKGDAAKKKQGPQGRKTILSYRGLCGNVFLVSTPAAARLGDVKVNTSVRKWELEVDAAVAGLAAGQQCKLRASVRDGNKTVKTLESKPFGAAELAGGRLKFAAGWQPEKLWDLHTPENQYDLKVELLDGAGKLLDEFWPVRFGFREFWVEGREFRLNGTRLWCMIAVLDNANTSPAACTYQTARETFRRLKKTGMNTVYEHNYGCQPGANLQFSDILRAADDEGMLVAHSLPNFNNYGWRVADKEPEKTSGYMQDAEYFIREAQNHPAVVMYAASHNSFDFVQSLNPDFVDSGAQSLGEAAYPLKVEKAIHAFDTTRPIYHHAVSGKGLQMYTLNCYQDFAPIQERSDWWEHWNADGHGAVDDRGVRIPVGPQLG